MGLSHALQLYQDEPSLADQAAQFIDGGLGAREAVVVIATKPRWNAVIERLPGAEAAVSAGQLRFVPARSLLENCADQAGFRQALGGILGLARLRFKGLRVFVEMSDLLWRQGDREGALRLERYWRSLHESAPFGLLCSCPLDSLQSAAYDGTLQQLCALHTHLVPAPDAAAFDEAVARAVNEVLDPKLARMLHALAATHRPAVQMPPGQALLFWLAGEMPRTAEKVLARARVIQSAQWRK